MTSKIEISHRTIIFIIALLAAIWLILAIRDILFLLFISFIVMSALRPLVDMAEKKKIPRVMSILVVYIVVIGGIGAAISSLIPPLITQTTRFIANFPNYVALIAPYYQMDIRSITSQIAPISENIVRVTVGIFSNIVTTMTVLVFTFYLLLEHESIERYIRKMLSLKSGEKVISTLNTVEMSLGGWLRGELVLMFAVGLLSYIGLSFLRIDYALPLAIIAGLLEIIPVIGPIVSAVPAVLVALSISPFLGLAAVALYFIIQQLENNIIVPVVMKKAVGISPLIVIISLMVGSRLAGLAGAVLAIPVVVMMRAIIVALLASRETSAES